MKESGSHLLWLHRSRYIYSSTHTRRHAHAYCTVYTDRLGEFALWHLRLTIDYYFLNVLTNHECSALLTLILHYKCHSVTVWIRQEHRQSLQTGVSAVIIHRYHNRMSSRLFTCQPEGWTGKNIPHWGRLAVSLIITYVTRSKFRRVFCALPTCLNIKLRS